MLRIAVFHHNTRAVQHQEDFLDPKYLQILKRQGFDLCLHGHVHSAGIDIFDPIQTRTLPVLGAGSLAASYQDRPPAVPKGYNLIVVNRETAAVFSHTRRHDENDLIWAPDYRWDGKPYLTLRSPGLGASSAEPESAENVDLTIVTPAGARFEGNAPSDVQIEQLLHALLQKWRPTEAEQSQRYFLHLEDDPAHPLEKSSSLREAGITGDVTLVLATASLQPDSAVGLMIEDRGGQRYTTAVLLSTPVVKLADAFSFSPYLCYFMAVRHTLGNRTLLLAKSTNHLPALLQRHHTLAYGGMDTHQFVRTFRTLVKAMQDGEDKDPDNPILESLQAKIKQDKQDAREADLKKREAELRAKAEQARKQQAEPGMITFRRVD